ncbi:MAG TPA: acyl carrier protein [Polyangiaceae bacterium]|jgi:acyl carrier protein|nr:acyl carrier protein [Polyangiaceae bacterium]
MESGSVPQPIEPSQQIIEQVNRLMQEGFELPAEKLVPTATLVKDLGLDSLDAVDMLVHIEEKLGIKVAGDQLMNMRTLQDVYILAQEATLQSSGKSNAGE